MPQVDWLNLHPSTVTHPGMWDDTFLQETLSGLHGPVPESGNIVVIPGRYHALDISRINRHLKQYDHVLVIVTADEENVFPVDLLVHERLVVWVQTLRPGRFEQGYGRFPLGYPPGTREYLALENVSLDVPDRDWFFAGQITHDRRNQAVQALSVLSGGTLTETPGFTQGMDREIYLETLAYSRIAPSPSGPATQECFRMWEALQAGSIPILDASTPDRIDDGYWPPLLGADHPLPVLQNWSDIGTIMQPLVDGWPHTANRVQAWWTRYRRMWPQCLTEALLDLDPTIEDPNGPVTVLIPTSPVPSHPDTSIIETTVSSVRERYPTADIRIMVDGVRPEQWDRMPNYQEYTRRLLWLANNEWFNVQVTVHDTHMHQAQMTRHELATIDTPLLLFVEHDTPLTGDWPVNEINQILLSNKAGLVRLHHEHMIHPEHQHLMLDDEPQDVGGLRTVRTIQWSQRPHVAKTNLYRQWLDRYFGVTERSMIEDRMHSVVQQYPDRFNILLYTPDGNQQRSIHLDARGKDRKWVTD